RFMGNQWKLPCSADTRRETTLRQRLFAFLMRQFARRLPLAFFDIDARCNLDCFLSHGRAICCNNGWGKGRALLAGEPTRPPEALASDRWREADVDADDRSTWLPVADGKRHRHHEYRANRRGP